MSHNSPRRILTQKEAMAANKTFKPTLVGGGPLREGIRFQENVFKIELLEALSLYVFRAVSSAKATALTPQIIPIFQLLHSNTLFLHLVTYSTK